MTQRMWRTASVLLVATLVAGALGTHGRLWDKPNRTKVTNATIVPAAKQDVGAGVQVVGAKAPVALHALVVSSRLQPSLRLATAVSQTFSVGPSGPLKASLTLEFPLERKVAADGRTVVFASESVKGSWTPLRTIVTADGLHVRVMVRHLSFFNTVHIDVDGALQVLKQFFDGLTSHIGEDAAAPHCTGQAQARQDGYLVTVLGKDSILWCFGMQNGKLVLKAVNNRRYPLLALHTGLSVLAGGSGGTIAQKIARRLSSEGTVIYPRDEAVFAADVRRGTNADLEATVGAEAQLLSSLDVGVKAMFAIITRFGASDDPTTVLKVVDTILTSDACVKSKNSGEMIANCLNAKQIIDAFGAVWGVILAPIVTVAGVVDYLHGAVNGILDQLSDRSWAKIVIQRMSAPPFAEFVGEWSVHGGRMTIRQDHTGESDWNAGPCLNALTTPPPPMCRGHTSLKLVSSPKGIIVTITRVWFTTWANAAPPAGFDPGTSIPQAGDTSEITWQAPGLLKERIIRSHLSPLDIKYGNPYWCGKGISAENQRRCGA